MKTFKIIFTISVVLNILLIAILLSDNSIDTVSQATPKDVITLPQEHSDYDVVGIVPGIKKFVIKYNDKLFRGGLPYSEKGYNFLAQKGIKTVISIVPDDGLKKWASIHNVKVIDLPFEKSKGLSTKQHNQLVKIYKEEVAPFYVHCHGGTHRASACAAIYRTELEGWALDKAVKEYDLLGGDSTKEKKLIDSIN